MEPVTDDEARIRARYPRRTTADVLLGGIALVGVLGAIAVVLVTGLVRANPPVVAMVRSFEVVSPTVMEAELVVQRKEPSAAAQCRVFAQAESYERVAEATIDVPPGTETLTTVDISLSTIKEATAIEIEYCQLSD